MLTSALALPGFFCPSLRSSLAAELTSILHAFRLGANRHLSQLPSDRFGWMIKPKPKLDCSMILQERQPYFIQVRRNSPNASQHAPRNRPVKREWEGMASYPSLSEVTAGRPDRRGNSGMWPCMPHELEAPESAPPARGGWTNAPRTLTPAAPPLRSSAELPLPIQEAADRAQVGRPHGADGHCDHPAVPGGAPRRRDQRRPPCCQPRTVVAHSARPEAPSPPRGTQAPSCKPSLDTTATFHRLSPLCRLSSAPTCSAKRLRAASSSTSPPTMASAPASTLSELPR